jgi:hypothetical protein
MIIQCTKKLLDGLKIKSPAEANGDPFFSWHANLITVNRKKTVVLVNDKNKYVIVLHGLKAKDFKHLGMHLKEAIRETFQDEGLKEEVIEEYINQTTEFTYTKTKDRSSVARLNKACENIPFFDESIIEGSIIQSAISMKVSRLLIGVGKQYVTPSEELYKDLEAFSGKQIFGAKAVQLKITLDLKNHDVWREIVMPINTTFYKLHEVIQAAFGWQGYHLHEFFIYGKEKSENEQSINHSAYHKEGYTPVINLACGKEAFAYVDDEDVPMKLEKGVKLLEYIPARMKYNYDFGDNWQHYIEVTNMLDDYDKNYPICLEGHGKTPPEDVGGEGGYEAFLEAISNADHPDHELMASWGESQGYKDFDIDEVNIDIKFAYRRR